MDSTLLATVKSIHTKAYHEGHFEASDDQRFIDQKADVCLEQKFALDPQRLPQSMWDIFHRTYVQGFKQGQQSD